MHQTFYIDLEEEISSVIDRLNKSMSTDNYFVVPKRAIFLQSIVNLKLLKREADKIGKNVTIITQDELGASMAERSGLSVQSSINESEQEKEDYEDDQDDQDLEDGEEMTENVPEIIERPVHRKNERLLGVGTDGFYDTSHGRHVDISNHAKSVKISHANAPVHTPKKTPRIYKELPQINLKEKGSLKNDVVSGAHKNIQHVATKGRGLSMNGIGLEKEKVLEKMYSTHKTVEHKKEVARHPAREKLIKKFFMGFVFLCLLAFGGVAAYLFWPSAKIIIEPNITTDKIDLDIKGDINLTKVDNGSIPVSVIDKEIDLTLPYEVKGSVTVAGKKAHGEVVIYNNFDSSSQALIATTRLESTDGKIFRIVKNVVVPGTTTVGGEVKPGAITAEVIADQAGPEYNLEPTTFTIPGFKDSPKYNKFSAKSSEKMIGGTASDTTSTGGAVSQVDIDNAKQKTEVAIKDKIAKELEEDLPVGVVALAQAEKITITKSSAGVRVGTVVSNFDYSVLASVRVLVFSEDDVRKVIEQSLVDKQKGEGVKNDIAKVEYGTVNADFDKNTLEFRIHSNIVSTPTINVEQFKADMLGKSDGQLTAVLQKYGTIKNVKIEFQPTFVSRVPDYSQRVTVEIVDNSN